ncbi:uncharacterized protein IL334_003318 [Kwoniella shivajii]|uniref:Putative tyrosine-protein phosphatase OCA1 n=1 Tax=Kwoniella shivajii TaxID=564305 RepID=A0ABZ1CX93_9TREE|nr:hypothetical protein IL334_003318 [Kwoniella shivajii]
MLTPPYHFSIVASPCPSPSPILSSSSSHVTSEILYRGSLPLPRNQSFIRRLNLKTLVVLRKKQLKEDDPLLKWTRKRGIQVKWVKADEMSEEKLGMGKNEVSEVLKIILDPKSYPLYIADIDGISHTTLIVSCLRKLQGWNMDCIVNEICRFEPEYEDLPLMPFVQSYLSQQSSTSTAGTSSSSSSSQNDTAFMLPQPPYPSWIWPSQPQSQSSLTSATISSQPNVQNPGANMKLRDRSTSTAASNSTLSNPSNANTSTNSSSSNISSSNNNSALLPFPHPLIIRKHPTMKLTFPVLPLPTPPIPSNSPLLSPSGLTRVSSRRAVATGVGSDKSALISPLPLPTTAIPSIPTFGEDGILGQAFGALHNGLTGMANILAGTNSNPTNPTTNTNTTPLTSTNPTTNANTNVNDPAEEQSNKLGRTASPSGLLPDTVSQPHSQTLPSFQQNQSQQQQQGLNPSTHSSPLKLSREATISSSDQYISESNDSAAGTEEDVNSYVGEYEDDDDVYYEDEDDDDDDDDDEDDDDEDEDDEDESNEPTSQYISALDLAGFG